MQRRGETAACAFHSRHTHRGTDIWHALSHPHQPVHPSRFLRCKRGGERLRHVPFIQGIYIKVRTVLHALSQIHQPTHPSRFLAMQRKVSTAHMRFIQSIYIEVRIFGTPCPNPISQPIHHVFLRCKEAGQCGIYVSFKAYTSRYGYFACLVPNPPANSSIAFSCDAKKSEYCACAFHSKHIHQGTDIRHALSHPHQPVHPSRFLAMQRKVSTAACAFHSKHIHQGTDILHALSQPH